MIQRSQSIYLFFAVLIAGFYFNYSSVFMLKIVSSIIAILSLITLILYKNRSLQLRLSNIIIGTILMLVALQIYKFSNNFMANIMQFVFPILMIIQVLMAVNGIKRDEALIRSQDRLR